MPLEWKRSAIYPVFWHGGEKCEKSTIFYYFCTAGAARRRPIDRAHNKFVQNTCKPMPLCFQIWQVSAKYCTFLDFLAHCYAFLSKSFWKRTSMMTIFWVTQWYRIVMKMNWKFLLISCQNPRYLLSLSHWTLKRGYSSKALEPHPVQMHVSTWVI